MQQRRDHRGVDAAGQPEDDLVAADLGAHAGDLVVDDVGGVMEVRSMRIPGRWGFLLHLAKIDPEGRAIWRAGGELMERYGLKRSAHRPGMTLDLKRDQAHMAVPDV
jgi:hypothetical protein